MEHAGKEVEDVASKKALAECGIGTPATRANIIETLILRDYIRREKKSIVPTEKGLAVYEMCIRDSICYINIKIDGINFHSIIHPVSYTHLDVYKRQVLSESLKSE